MGDKVEPGPYRTFENVLCEWEQRNGQIKGESCFVCLLRSSKARWPGAWIRISAFHLLALGPQVFNI